MQKIVNALQIRTSKNGKGYMLTYKGKDYKAKSLDDLAECIMNLPQVNFESWYISMMNLVRMQPYYAESSGCAATKQYITTELADTIRAKRDYRDVFQSHVLPSAFNAEITACKYKPSCDYNDFDKLMLQPFYFCEENECIYCKDGNSFTLIGTRLSLSDKRTNQAGFAANVIKKHLAKYFGTEKFELWGHFYKIADCATVNFFNNRRIIESAIDAKKKPSETKGTIFGKESCFSELFKLQTGISEKFNAWPEDWIDKLHDAIVKHLINEELPACPNNQGLIQVFHEANGEFYRYFIGAPRNGVKSTLSSFVACLFGDSCVLDIMNRIPCIPHIIYDTNEIATQYSLDSSWLNKLTNQKKIEDCKALKVFTGAFTKEEATVLMAWAYMALHPSTGENIGMLIQTGGGTFKTNYYSAMIKYLMSIMYNAPIDTIGFMMKKDEWVGNAKLREPSTRGISKAGFVIVDEASSKSIIQYKQWSGSTTSAGIDYEYSKIYEQGVQTKIYCPWLFLSNEDIVLGDDKGVYDRRLIVIKRMDLANLSKPYSFNYANEIRAEAKAFYFAAKKCYDSIKKTYGSLTDMNMSNESSIRNNLNTVFDEEGKMIAYYNIFDSLKNSNGVNGVIQCNDEGVCVTVGLLSTLIEQNAKENELNEGGLKKYIKTTNRTICSNVWGKAVRINGKVCKAAILYPLKDEFQFSDKKLQAFDARN